MQHSCSNGDSGWWVSSPSPLRDPADTPFPIFRSLRGCRHSSPAAYRQTALGRILISPLAAAILYFDFFLTLPAEVDRYWTGNGCSWASLLFFMNRYITLVFKIYAFMSFAPIFTSDSVRSCSCILLRDM